MSNFIIQRDSANLSIEKDFVFPGGELGIKLSESRAFKYDDGNVLITARIDSPDGSFKLALIKDAVENLFNSPIYHTADAKPKIDLFLPYVPYGRQDRVCDGGEANSLKVFGAFINSLGFRSVTIVDPHSEVTPTVLNNVRVITQANVINAFADFRNFCLDPAVVFVSPDAGANKKTAQIAKYFNKTGFIRADKNRELSTGKILETIVYADDLSGKTVVCCDDICDGGRTFIELAKALKDKKAKSVVLYVTHGIFSKGLDIIFENGIDKIYTTNSFNLKLVSDFPKFNVFDVRLFNV